MHPAVVYFNSISCMPEYAGKSVEELRWEDYAVGGGPGQSWGRLGQDGEAPRRRPPTDSLRSRYVPLKASAA